MNSEEWYRAHSSARKDVDYKSLSFNSQASNNNLQRSVSADNVVIRSRGFKPSDRHDPAKRNFLESLTSKILHFEMVSLSREEWKKSTRVFCDKQKTLIACVRQLLFSLLRTVLRKYIKLKRFFIKRYIRRLTFDESHSCTTMSCNSLASALLSSKSTAKNWLKCFVIRNC